MGNEGKECKGLCSTGVNKSRYVNYLNGYKFCRSCNKYFLQESFLCVCCRKRLRCKPANGNQREKLVCEARIQP